MEGHWQKFIEGSEADLELIYDMVYRELFAYGILLGYPRDMIKDAIQQLFTELVSKRAQLRSVSKPKAYLYTWLRRILNSERVKLAKFSTSWTINMDDLSEPSHEQIIVRAENANRDKQHLQSALQHLTEKQMRIVQLRFYEQLSHEEIARKLDLQTRTVYNTLYEAMKMLRKKIKNIR